MCTCTCSIHIKWIMEFSARPHAKICDQVRKQEINLKWPYSKLVCSVNPRLHLEDSVSNEDILYMNMFTHR